MEEKPVQKKSSEQPPKKRIRWGVGAPFVILAVIGLSFFTPPVQAMYKNLRNALSPQKEQVMSSEGESRAVKHTTQVVSNSEDVKIAGYLIDVDEDACDTEKKGSAITITPRDYPLSAPPLSLKIEQIPDITTEKVFEQEKKKIQESDPPPENILVPDKNENRFAVEPQRYRPVFFKGVWDWVVGVDTRYRPIKTVRVFDNGRGGVFLVTEVLYTRIEEEYAAVHNAMLSTLEILS